MLTKFAEFRLDHAIAEDQLGDEVAARLVVDSTPGDAAAAQAILALLDDSKSSEITEWLTVGLAGDAEGESGRELSQKINGMIGVLQAKANGTEIAAQAAQAVLNLTADITLESAVAGAARNGDTVTLEIEAAAANPTDTVLVDITGTASAIVITVTPNDGTNNGATPVDLTTAELVELINSGAVVGKTITLIDASSLREDQTASGGDATALADAGEGDGEVATFASGSDAADSDVAPAKAAMGSEPMSAQALEDLTNAMADAKAAGEIRDAYNAMVAAIQAVS